MSSSRAHYLRSIAVASALCGALWPTPARADVTAVWHFHADVLSHLFGFEGRSSVRLTESQERREVTAMPLGAAATGGSATQARHGVLVTRLDTKTIQVQPQAGGPVDDYPLSELGKAENRLTPPAPAPQTELRFKLGRFKATGRQEQIGKYPCAEYQAKARASGRSANGQKQRLQLVEKVCLASAPDLEAWGRQSEHFDSILTSLIGKTGVRGPLFSSASLALAGLEARQILEDNAAPLKRLIESTRKMPVAVSLTVGDESSSGAKGAASGIMAADLQLESLSQAPISPDLFSLRQPTPATGKTATPPAKH